MTLYHGMTVDFDAFTDEFVGNGHDQEGPGIYFSTSEKDAQTYCRGNGWLYTVEAKFRKLVPTEGRIKKGEVKKLISQAPGLDDTLTDWDENRSRAFDIALAAMLKNESPHQAFQGVWYDFYRKTPVQYLRNMVELGYDGVRVPRTDEIVHYIVFNPKAVTITNKQRVE